MSNLSHKQRSLIKDMIVHEVSQEWAERYDITEKMLQFDAYRHWTSGNQTCRYQFVNNLIREWAGGASQEFHNNARVALLNEDPEVYDKNKIVGSLNESNWTRQILRVIADRTQKELKARGIRYITGYRGMKCKMLSPRTLQSFSTSKKVAESFMYDWDSSSGVYKASIPSQYIVSTFYTGYGCAEEQEYVVLGVGRLMRHIKNEN